MACVLLFKIAVRVEVTATATEMTGYLWGTAGLVVGELANHHRTTDMNINKNLFAASTLLDNPPLG